MIYFGLVILAGIVVGCCAIFFLEYKQPKQTRQQIISAYQKGKWFDDEPETELQAINRLMLEADSLNCLLYTSRCV